MIITSLGAYPRVCAAQRGRPEMFSYTAMRSIRNPFISQLPEIKKPAPIKKTTSGNSGKKNGSNISSRNRRNPLQKFGIETKKAKVIKPPTFKLSGIIWNSNLPQAIIDGEIVGIGHNIKNARITAINETGVTFIFNGSKHSLEISERSP